jgi:hypothetical protein
LIGQSVAMHPERVDRFADRGRQGVEAVALIAGQQP